MEGRRTPGILDRSLSQSFAEEKKMLSNKYKTDPNSTVPEEEPADDNVRDIHHNLVHSNNLLVYTGR